MLLKEWWEEKLDLYIKETEKEKKEYDEYCKRYLQETSPCTEVHESECCCVCGNFLVAGDGERICNACDDDWD